ncbi:ATP-binding protein [Lactiplantibacillus paraplantarum]|uniref:ATP-binding protein n=1 Tax=Lactiplantibacillus paraplantarum TaxID=60520 RepID=UPI003DA5903B
MENEVILQQSELGYELTTRLVNQIVEKNYLNNLTNMPVLPFPSLENGNILSKIRMYKISEIVFAEEEDITQKLANVYNAFTNRQDSLFLLIDSKHNGVTLYLGVRLLTDDHSIVTSAELLKKSLIGQFPGITLSAQSNAAIGDIQNELKNNSCFATVSGIPSLQTKETAKNGSFIQGLEKVINSLQGETYQGIVLASNIGKAEISDLRQNYENIYSQLVPLKKTSVTYGQNQSYTEGSSLSNTTSTSNSVSNSVSYSYSKNSGVTKTNTVGSGMTEDSKGTKIARGIGAAVGVAGMVIAATNPEILVGAAAEKAAAHFIANGVKKAAAKELGGQMVSKMVADGTSALGAGISGVLGGKQESHSESTSTATSESHGSSKSNSNSTSQSTSHGQTEGTSTSSQLGQTQSKQTEYENKTVSNMLGRLDQQFERMSDFDDTSAWEFAAYFMSKEADIVEIASSTYQSVISGDDSGIQVAAVNHWLGNGRVPEARTTNINELREYFSNFMQPEFLYNEYQNQPMGLRATSIISSSELAIAMGLPRHSVVGVPVIKHARFAQNTFRLNDAGKEIELGEIYQVGSKNSAMPAVNLQLDSLSGHTFITGSTGSGKSNTVYRLLSEALTKKINFMVIEPAKGEYKNVFGNREDVNVYGTNPRYTPLLKINPFAFPAGVHIYEHIDRLIEIFNVSWPMYAAMPAILKKAIIRSYQMVGWDLAQSRNKHGETWYPSFKDLIQCLKDVINDSDYSDESKGNYIGSLVTRVESLANGLNGMIFTDDEIVSAKLFDENTIVDLSRVGSGETKALIMGILVMRLNEYRMSSVKSMNAPMKHLTVLEEAHNILKNTSQSGGGPEGANMAGKSVEMLSNSIAEMRTYGEGFIIVDQTPSAVDSSAIRNTNTKIIMRLPDFQDRNLVGRSAALNEKQLDEIALLPKGVAVVYQNNWLEPVLCAIDKANSQLVDETSVFDYQGSYSDDIDQEELEQIVYDLIFIGRVSSISAKSLSSVSVDRIHSLPLSTRQKQLLVKRLRQWRIAEQQMNLPEKQLFYQVLANQDSPTENWQHLNKLTGNEAITDEIVKMVGTNE